MTTIVGRQSVISPLIEQELALKVYIDALLTEMVPEAEAPGPEPSPPAEAVATPVPVIAPAPAPAVAAAVETGVPAWAQPSFDALMFRVAGSLTLSVPLLKLHGIVPWSPVTAVPGHASWFLGILPHRGVQVKVIDIARFVIPENHTARATINTAPDRFKRIVLIGDGEWGLACDDIGMVLKLAPDKVRWRTVAGNRPWLAGMVTEQMCALLDADKIVELLKKGRGLVENNT